ncbi:MAG: type 4a pilus biogenesis protein PilO [Candidatus Omnitrophota bacterium]
MDNINFPDLFNKNKNMVINGLIVIVAMFISFNVYSNQNKQIVALGEQKDQEVQKNQILVEIAGLEKKVNIYTKKINSKDTSSIINKIGNIAKTSSIELVSIRPDKVGDYGQYTKYNFTVNVDSDSYHKLGVFVSRLENSPDIYFIDNMQISVQQEGESRPSKLSVSLNVSTILIKG